jgi:propionyl-CoA carboxylase alpha chain
MIKKLLIANRGEIAVRIMQTARRLGIATVAVYSEADTSALFVQMADEAVFIGPSPSTQSYLRIPAIVNAIRQTGADAVHPGYGFLSENTDFCKAVEQEGVIFIGPSATAIKQMGDKLEAKKIAKEAGVSILPGSEGAVEGIKEAKQLADEIGYPVMIKAAAGGGGKGMRVVFEESELEEGIRGAVHEAGSSFGDNRVFIEKFITNPRHIEIQVLADKFGGVVTLGERECSIQRRHQKVIEEAPSPFLTPEVREAMSKQAVSLVKQVGYYSAGTVEFIMDEQRNFYFLEMNTRLQVEHRVTELITGIDLVEQMIRVAEGERLPFIQEDIKFHGHAIESRIYAEDPTRNFMPSVGRISRYQEPEQIPGMVLDTGVYEGSEVSMFYDPMVAKLCTYGENRDRAIDEMRAALGAFVIRGISHNISFLEAIINNPRFAKGHTTTNFIAEEYPNGFTGAELTSEAGKWIMATALFVHLKLRERDGKVSGQLPGHPVVFLDRWAIKMAGEEHTVSVSPRENGYDINYQGEHITIRSPWQTGRRLFQGTINGKPVIIKVHPLIEGYRLLYSGSTVDVIVRTPRAAAYAKYLPETSHATRATRLEAPMAGLIVSVRVKEGDTVKPGTELVAIEAMKMENLLRAEYPAIIKSIHVAQGDPVQTGQIMIEFDINVAEDKEEKTEKPAKASAKGKIGKPANAA